MEKYDQTVASSIDGKPIQGAQANIYSLDDPSNPTLATVYADEAGTMPMSQPILTDQLGYFFAYVPDGAYDVRVMAGSIEISRTNVKIVDSLALKQRALLVPMNEDSGTLPPAGERAGKLLGFDDDGNTVVQEVEALAGPPGPAGNVAATLDQLKAAPTTNGTMIAAYDGSGSTMTWTTGDFTTQAAQRPQDYVQANGIPLTTGAWVRQGAQGITAQAPETGAVPISQSDKNRTSVSVFEFIPASLHAGILLRTPSTDKAAAVALSGYIQTAIDAAVSTRRTLTIPAGLYTIAPREAFDAEAGPCQRCFALRSGLDIFAELGATFRIVDGVSTNSAPVFMAMFAGNGQYDNMSWRGLTMDMNGPNNPISPRRAEGIYALFNQAMIHVTGTPGGVAALANDVLVENCTFTNCPGVSGIVMAQSNKVGAPLGERWTVRNNRFFEFGYDSHDCSIIFGWARNVEVYGNRFINSRQFGMIGEGAFAAYEVHGSNQSFRDNYMENLYQCAWIDTNNTERTENIEIRGNKARKMKMRGFEAFGLAPGVLHPRNVRIIDNDIEFDNNTHPGVLLKVGIGILCPQAMADWYIGNNKVKAGGSAVGSAAVAISAGPLADQKHTDIIVDGVIADGTTLGVSLTTNATNGLGDISVANVKSRNLTPAGAFGFPQGISFGGSGQKCDSLTIRTCDAKDNRGIPQTAFAIRLEGPVGLLDVDGNTADGMTTSRYEESSFTADRRKGVYERVFAYDPPSMAANGVTPIVTVPFAGAEGGDQVTIAFNDNPQGARFTAFVSSTDEISFYAINEAGPNPNDLPASSVRVRLTKPAN